MIYKNTKEKKHLSFDALRKAFSHHLLTIPDQRQAERCDHSLHDAVMSAFACMFFQEPSILQFQKQMQKTNNRNNLCTLFDVETIPKDSQLRTIVDAIDSEHFRPVFKDYFEKLRNGRQLTGYKVLGQNYLCSIDGTYYHSSERIHCKKCLHKKHRNGVVSYSHGILQGAITHPNKRQVIPVMPEVIANQDGSYKKQDCEINAAKRFIQALKKDHPRLKLIITGDSLFSKTPMIKTVLNANMHYLFIAKPNDHKYMMEWVNAFDQLPSIQTTDLKQRKHRCSYVNGVPLNGQSDAQLVNYLYFEMINQNGKVVYKNSWVTDMEITDNNALQLAKSGRCRWKIENECFNTLKNQGYYLEHNFGHGKDNLSHNLYLATLLAFFYHQIFELSDAAYQRCRQTYGSKRHLWETFRVLICFFIFEDWNELLAKLMSGRGGMPFFEKV